jgi:acyl-CoA synthetase (NDP forming)
VKYIYKEIKVNFKKYLPGMRDPRMALAAGNSWNPDHEELMDAVKTLEKLPFPAGNRVAVIGSVFGCGSVCADFVRNTATHSVKLHLVKLSEETQRKIKKAVPQIVFCQNPVDIAAVVSGEEYAAILQILLDASEADILLCQRPFDAEFAGSLQLEAEESLIKKIAGAVEFSSKPVIFFCSSGHSFQCPGQEIIVEFPTLSRVIRAAQLLVDYKNALEIKALEANLGSAISFS